VVEQTRPRCCGFGGNVHALSTELADASTNEVMVAAGNATIVTYCMACKDRFLSKGRKTNHILELLVSATPVTSPISSARKWFNRFILMLTGIAGQRS
jgi:Fe-S oxidoreductase